MRLNQDVFLRLISAVRAGPLQPGQPGLRESCTSPDGLSPFLPDLSLGLQAASLQSSSGSLRQPNIWHSVNRVVMQA